MAVCCVVPWSASPRGSPALPASPGRRWRSRCRGGAPPSRSTSRLRHPGFDTFGETFLLLAAVISVMALARAARAGASASTSARSVAGRREQARGRPAAGADPSRRGHAQAERNEQPEALGRHAVAGGSTADPDDEPLGRPRARAGRGDDASSSGRGPRRRAVLAVGGIYLAAWGYSPGGGFPAGAVLLGVHPALRRARLRAGAAGSVRSGSVLEPLELAGAAAIIAIEAARPGPQGVVLAPTGSRWPAAGDDPQRRHPAGLLRRRADRGGDRADHRGVRAAGDDATTGRRTSRRDRRRGDRQRVWYQWEGCRRAIGPGGWRAA